jgi:hypothetical protein
MISLIVLFKLLCLSQAFAPHLQSSSSYITNFDTKLYGGTGRTEKFRWTESQFEIEIKIPVPTEATAKNISYKVKSKCIGLDLVMNGETVQLLDINREFRGMIDLDGTFWTLVDSDDHEGRDVVISIEKFIVPPNDPFEVVNYDWNGIYPNDDDEVLEKVYAEPEELDIREYASSLGVDIDNINMTLVDKNMFSSGLNMTRNTLDELTNAGYAKEVTRLGDGTELIDKGDKGTIPFEAFGENVGKDEISDAGIDMSARPEDKMNPFISSDSPWLRTMPAEESVPTDSDTNEATEENDSRKLSNKLKDPIDNLTVAKLKDVLRKEGLKVSGTKDELKERLKTHVRLTFEKNQKNKNWQ